jgi:hypothetical protein
VQTLLAAVLAALAAAAPAPSLTLYDQPGFKGRSVTLSADSPDLGALAAAGSAQVRGRWRVCAAPGPSARCRLVSRDIADLTALGLASRVVSAALDMGYSQDRYAPDPFAYDVEDYSAPPRAYPGPAYPVLPYPYPDPGAGPSGAPVMNR